MNTFQPDYLHTPPLRSPFPFYALKKSQGKNVENAQESLEEEATEEKKEEILHCVNCGNIIASLKDAIEIHGKHTHTCKNPQDILFNIGCFAFARGCVVRGQPTLEYTWFPGFGWSIALCSECAIHLGWFYESGEGENFFGLIMNHLVKGP